MIKESLRGQYAGFVSRFVAFIIDIAVISVTIVVVSWVITRPAVFFGIDITGRCVEVDVTSVITFFQTIWCVLLKALLPIVAFLILIGYPLILWSLTGQTVGKYAMGVKIVRMDGQPMGFFNSVRRLFGYVISFLVLGLGFIWILVSNLRQGWHDNIAGTYVIYSWDAKSNERLEGWIARFAGRLVGRRQPAEMTQSMPEEPPYLPESVPAMPEGGPTLQEGGPSIQ